MCVQSVLPLRTAPRQPSFLRSSKLCADNFHKASCECPEGSCQPCEERCRVIGINPHDNSLITECFDGAAHVLSHALPLLSLPDPPH